MATGIHTELNQLIQLKHQAQELQLFSRTKAQSQLIGNVKTHFRGRGIDFEEVRNYQAGDEIRAIDWRVTARTGVAHTKVFREERERPVYVLVDQRPNMAFGSQRCFKSVQAAEIASLLCWAALKQNDRIGGLVFDGLRHQEVRPARSRSAVLQFLNAIEHFNHRRNAEDATHNATIQSATPSSINASINDAIVELRRISRPGSALFIVSDFIGLNEDGIKQLHHLNRHCDISAFFISDPMEQHLPSGGGHYFTDGQRRLRLDRNQRSLKMFEEHFQQRRSDVLSQLANKGIPTIEISTTDEAIAVLSHYYHPRGASTHVSASVNVNTHGNGS